MSPQGQQLMDLLFSLERCRETSKPLGVEGPALFQVERVWALTGSATATSFPGLGSAETHPVAFGSGPYTAPHKHVDERAGRPLVGHSELHSDCHSQGWSQLFLVLIRAASWLPQSRDGAFWGKALLEFSVGHTQDTEAASSERQR